MCIKSCVNRNWFLNAKICASKVGWIGIDFSMLKYVHQELCEKELIF
jgi:hypothetical protein